jgi:DNA-binding NarL/FixJ family response regulator
MLSTPQQYEQAQAVAKRRLLVKLLTWEGLNTKQIAAHLNICTRTVVRDRHISGVVRPANRPWTEQEHIRAKQLIADGASITETAKTLGRSVSTIQVRFVGEGWTPEQTGQYNMMRRYEKRMLG